MNNTPNNHLNFLPNQYRETGKLNINHNYLDRQFSDYPEILKKIEGLVQRGDFTLGEEVDRFERRFAEMAGTPYAIGVGSGTDALFLSLKALGIKEGDEVITTPFTFFATIGAIVTAGARPVFADVGKDYNLDPSKIESKITSKTKAILPVHWSGLICDMFEINAIAKKHGLYVVEDSCHAINATYKGQRAGSFGDLAGFSMHPLKNLNIWGDGGVITTRSKDLYEKLSLMRNHGLASRDVCEVFSYNSRLDTLQAIVANHLLNKIETITNGRIANSNRFDEKLRGIPQLNIPTRNPDKKHVYHLYMFGAEDRDGLKAHLIKNGIDAKVHYPIPMHLQPAAKDWGYRKGDFPIAEGVANSVISLPVHEFITEAEQDIVVDSIRRYYS